YSVHIVSPTTDATGLTSPVDNHVSVTTTNDGSDSADASVEVRRAAIDVAKTADSPSVSAGDQIGFTITVSNNGTGTARNVTVHDLLPTDAGLNWSIDGPDNGCSISGGSLECGPADLAPGFYSVHIVSPTTDATGLSSPVDNHVSVTTTNDGSDTADASVQVRRAVIDIAKVADNPAVSAGDQIGFTITVTNSGTGTARNVSVHDLLPTDAGLSWSIDGPDHGCSISGGSLDCGPADLAPGFFSVHIVSPTTDATGLSSPVDNHASVTTTNDGSDTADASVEVRRAIIDIAKVADSPSVSAGDQIGFTLTVTNGGTGIARNVTVHDLLPTDAGLSWSIDGPNHGCVIIGGSLDCGPADLTPGLYSVHIVSPTT